MRANVRAHNVSCLHQANGALTPNFILCLLQLCRTMSSSQLTWLNMSLNLEMKGWTDPDGVWRYIKQTRKAGTRDMAVIKFTPRSDQDVKHYAALLARVHKSGRLAVTGPASVHVKDLYLVPLLKDDPVPPELDPLIKGKLKRFCGPLKFNFNFILFRNRFGAHQAEECPAGRHHPGPEEAARRGWIEGPVFQQETLRPESSAASAAGG